MLPVINDNRYNNSNTFITDLDKENSLNLQQPRSGVRDKKTISLDLFKKGKLKLIITYQVMKE